MTLPHPRHRSDDIMTAVKHRRGVPPGLHHRALHRGLHDCGCSRTAPRPRHHRPLPVGPGKEQELWIIEHGKSGYPGTPNGIDIALTADDGSRTAYLPATIGLLLRRGLSEKAAFEGVTIQPAPPAAGGPHRLAGAGQGRRHRHLRRTPVQQLVRLPHDHHRRQDRSQYAVNPKSPG